MISNRREFGRLALAGLAMAGVGAARDTRYKGVRLGVGSYTFRGLQLDEIIRIVAGAGAHGIELESPYVEPVIEREALRQWRLSVSMGEFQAIRKKMERAGIRVYAYSVPVNDSFTDAEMERVLLMTKALGAAVFNTSASLPVAKRLAPLAERHKVVIGLHPNGSAESADSIGSGASYLRAFEISPVIYANLDLYLYRNWGPDPIAFLKQVNRRVTTLHFHDRKVNQTPAVWVPFGEGDTPAKELLLLAQKEKYPFTFSIERIYTFPGLDQLTEMRRSLDYCRKVLG